MAKVQNTSSGSEEDKLTTTDDSEEEEEPRWTQRAISKDIYCFLTQEQENEKMKDWEMSLGG